MTGKVFAYEDFSVDEDRRVASFRYRIDTDEKSYELTETLTFPDDIPTSYTVDRLLRTLHLALGISYYKTFLPPEITHNYHMDHAEADFWNNVFRNGLGEFLHDNNLGADKLAQFASQEGSIRYSEADDIDWKGTALLGIGGGKDSIVAGELLKEMDVKQAGFVLATGNHTGQAKAVANTMSIDMFVIERRIDQQILDMNEMPGALNGHVPISLIFALVGSLLACTLGAQYVIVANESSASIPQIMDSENFVNHQWSKSFDFERKFQTFVQQRISPNLHYLSIIRQLSSVAVAKLFSRYPAYFEIFTSDNSLFKISQDQREHPRWSIDSPKSLSSFILLAPWISDEDLMRIFGQNFLNRSELEQLFMELLGQGEKPVLDCVGTPDELRLSLSMLLNEGRFTESPLMTAAVQKDLLNGQFEDQLSSALTLNADHAIPDELLRKLEPLLTEKLG